ncbi:MAG: TetR family transcriptional regulator [Streptosporangiales bacterium]|nr:TetR family transcriptional regulator [Streptosporangiales bacterium]
MARLSRVELQRRNRQNVLAAARAEFAERGYRGAKVDQVAERAGLTRGAVYSNFPGKRALYFAVLAELAEQARPPAHPDLGHDLREALGAFARAWMGRSVPDAEAAGLARDLYAEVLDDERVRRPFAGLLTLDAIVLGLALEGLRPGDAEPVRLVRIAEAALTTLHGARQLLAAAPGFVEPFTVVEACAELAAVAITDRWPPPDAVPPVRPVDLPWDPPDAVDLLRGDTAQLAGDGVLAVLGLHRLAAIEEAVRAAPPGVQVTAVVVTGRPGELMPLARLLVTELGSCLRQAIPPSAWPRLQVVCDETGTLAAAADLPAVSDATEAAVRVRAGRLLGCADGRGAGHAVAAGTPVPR